MYLNLNSNQKEAADAVLKAVRETHKGYFFIDGPGGSGKTYLYKTLYNIAIGEDRRVLCVAWSGIAANLLPGGRTVNSAFKLNIRDQNRSSTMSLQEKAARDLADLHMIIWDEISMVPKDAC